MKRYAVEIELRIRGKVYVEDKSTTDAMRYAESRDADELLDMMENRADKVFVDDVYELKD